jgi:uncharacterized protein (DUF1778 family)
VSTKNKRKLYLKNYIHVITTRENPGAAYAREMAHCKDKVEGLRPKPHMAMKPKKKKNNQKPKLNVTVHEAQRNKLEQMASIKKRSVSDLIEVMADERWERLVGQQGIAYARTVAEAMNLKLDMDTPADREKLRRAISRSCRRERNAKAKTAWLKFFRSLSAKHFCSAIHRGRLTILSSGCQADRSVSRISDNRTVHRSATAWQARTAIPGLRC